MLGRVAPVQPREGAQTPKRAQIQADVLAATERLLGEGTTFADLNVERIATAAGISRTAFYFYFRDKREVLMRLAGDLTDVLYREAEVWFAAGEGDPETQIRQALENISAIYREHQALLRAIVELSTYDEEIATFWRGLVGRFIDATAVRIEAEQAAGRAPAMDPRPTAFALVWMVERTLYQQLVQGEPFGREQQVDAFVGIWMRSIYGRA